jgi:hypothetical protein
MKNKETRERQRPVAHPSNIADAEKAESGPPRLHAPGRPHEVESGPPRLRTSVLGPHQARGAHTVASPRLLSANVDTTEAGPARLVQYRK